MEQALRDVADADADPDPPEAAPPDLVADLMADLVTNLDADTDAERLLAALHAADATALKAGPVALRHALVAAHLGDEAQTSVLDVAERELQRRECSARRHERAAQLAVDRAAGNGLAAEEQRKLLKAARTALSEALTMRRTIASARVRASPVTVPDINEDRPERLLSAAGKSGSLLSVGNLLVLAGEGGIAKGPLALSVALGMADFAFDEVQECAEPPPLSVFCGLSSGRARVYVVSLGTCASDSASSASGRMRSPAPGSTRFMIKGASRCKN